MVRSPIWSPDIVLTNRNFLPPVVQHLPKAFLLVLIVAEPAAAQRALWEEYRDRLLGQNQLRLIEFCSLGKKLNETKLSYWEAKGTQQGKGFLGLQDERKLARLRRRLAYSEKDLGFITRQQEAGFTGEHPEVINAEKRGAEIIRTYTEEKIRIEEGSEDRLPGYVFARAYKLGNKAAMKTVCPNVW